MHAELIVGEGSNQGSRFVIRPGQRFEIGRSGVSVLIEDDASVSRKHARIELRADGNIYLADLNSRNGTFIGEDCEQLMPHLPKKIRSGTRIAIGAQVLYVTIDSSDEDTRRAKGKRGNTDKTILPDLELLGVIGRGAHGLVYAAYQRLMDRRVAVKVLHASKTDEELLERFLQEGRLACRVRSPYVVEVYDFRLVDEQVFLIMELVDGITLLDRLEDRILAIPDALRVAEEVALGLAAVHQEGIVHRDVKPSNVLLAPSGRALLSDFGIAKDLLAKHITPLEVGFGSLPYIAPEQAMSAVSVDARADVYSLGATLYHMLTGHSPFKGRPAIEILERTAPLASVASLNKACSEELSLLINAMLSSDRDARPSTAESVARQLNELRMLEFPESNTDARNAMRITQTGRLEALADKTLEALEAKAAAESDPSEPKTSNLYRDNADRSDTPTAPCG